MINHVSCSMLNLWCNCEVAWEFRYAKGKIIPPLAAAHRGGAMHKAIELNHKEKMITQKDLPTVDLIDACRDSFYSRCKGGVRIPKEERGRKDRILNNEQNLAIEHVKIYSNAIAPKIVPAIVEKKIWAHSELDLPLMGIIDVMDTNNVIMDFKSTERKKPKGWERTTLQPSFYTALIQSERGILPQFKYHIIKDSDDERDSTKTNKDIGMLLARIKIFIDSIKTGIFKPAAPGHWICSERWCGYWLICKYAQ